MEDIELHFPLHLVCFKTFNSTMQDSCFSSFIFEIKRLTPSESVKGTLNLMYLEEEKYLSLLDIEFPKPSLPFCKMKLYTLQDSELSRHFFDVYLRSGTHSDCFS